MIVDTQLRVIGFSSLFLLAALNASGADERSVDLFKRFIEAPPPVSNIIYVKEVPTYTTNFVRVRWQEPAIYVGWGKSTVITNSAVSEVSLTNYVEWIGRFENVYLLKALNAFYRWTNAGDTAEMGNRVDENHDRMINQYLTEILNMGCHEAPVGSIRWTGDSFTITNLTRGTIVTGKLSTDGLGRAREMSVIEARIDKPSGNKRQSVYTYEYEQPLSLRYLPSKIRGATEYDGRPWNFTYSIVSLDVASNNLGAESFLYVPEPEAGLIQITMSNIYRVYNNGTNIRVTLDRKVTAMKRESLRSNYFILAVALLAAIPIFWYVSYWKNAEQQKQKESKEPK